MTTAAGNLAEKKDEKVEKRRALGRGLASLLPGPRVVNAESRGAVVERGDSEAAAGEQQVPHFVRNDKSEDRNDQTHASASAALSELTPTEAGSRNVIVSLAVDSIEKNPYQTRQVFDEEGLVDLAASIKEHGVVQPVVVRPGQQGGYILVLGERRLRASKMAGKDTIPALVRNLSPQQAAEMTVLENVQREDLNCLEQAQAFRVLSQEFHLTQAQIAERIGVSRETVANYMRLLRLPEKVRGYMLEDRLSFSDARELLRLENEEHIVQVAEDIVNKRLKWDEIEERVMRLNGTFAALPGQGAGTAKKGRGARWIDPNVRAAQLEMERTLGMRVRIRDRNGKGRIVIEYASVDDYERVVEMLRKK
jgi:ParB family chromosome partitioning protein